MEPDYDRCEYKVFHKGLSIWQKLYIADTPEPLVSNYTPEGTLAHELLGHGWICAKTGLWCAKIDKPTKSQSRRESYNQCISIKRANYVRKLLGIPLRRGGGNCGLNPPE